jgi:hypothetical protein
MDNTWPAVLMVIISLSSGDKKGVSYQFACSAQVLTVSSDGLIPFPTSVTSSAFGSRFHSKENWRCAHRLAYHKSGAFMLMELFIELGISTALFPMDMEDIHISIIIMISVMGDLSLSLS